MILCFFDLCFGGSKSELIKKTIFDQLLLCDYYSALWFQV